MLIKYNLLIKFFITILTICLGAYFFLYRLFFITDSEINIAIHRNTSNNIKNHIRHILDLKKIKINKFIYLDDGFYLFKNSQIPCFLNLGRTVVFWELNAYSQLSSLLSIIIMNDTCHRSRTTHSATSE